MSERERELLPCPFCGGAMQPRDALWPSEGDTDAVIHAAPTDCPMVVFSNDTADKSVYTAWNRRILPPDAQPQAEASDLERRFLELAWAAIGESAQYTGTTEGSRLALRIAGALAEARAAGYAEAIRDAAKVTGSWRSGERIWVGASLVAVVEVSTAKTVASKIESEIRALAPSAATEGGEK